MKSAVRLAAVCSLLLALGAGCEQDGGSGEQPTPPTIGQPGTPGVNTPGAAGNAGDPQVGAPSQPGASGSSSPGSAVQGPKAQVPGKSGAEAAPLYPGLPTGPQLPTDPAN